MHCAIFLGRRHRDTAAQGLFQRQHLLDDPALKLLEVLLELLALLSMLRGFFLYTVYKHPKRWQGGKGSEVQPPGEPAAEQAKPVLLQSHGHEPRPKITGFKPIS